MINAPNINGLINKPLIVVAPSEKFEIWTIMKINRTMSGIFGGQKLLVEKKFRIFSKLLLIRNLEIQGGK